VLYNPLAWTYDWVSRVVSLGHWRDWQRQALRALRAQSAWRVLELAYGTGDMLLELHAARYCPVGVDLSPAMARIARRKLRRHGVNVPLVRGRAQQLPFADASFDAVLSTFPAEFIVAYETLSQIARVLRPGGRAVIVAMGRLTSRTLWARFLEWLYAITGQRGPLPDLRPQLEAAGLRHWATWVPATDSAVLLVILEK
jgi:ubiquinone/menaquinone biosynthesis C-methylase UbiE